MVSSATIFTTSQQSTRAYEVAEFCNYAYLILSCAIFYILNLASSWWAGCRSWQKIGRSEAAGGKLPAESEQYHKNIQKSLDYTCVN